jgi:hypothetical protein
MLTGSVPGTDIVVGMSRRLYSACHNLSEIDAEDLADLRAELGALPALDERYVGDIIDEEAEELMRARQELFAQREASSRPRQLNATRQGFDIGRRNSWPELLTISPRWIPNHPPACSKPQPPIPT